MAETRIFTVTGGLGFIGKHFVERLLADGHYVTNIDVVNYASDRRAAAIFNEFDRYRHIQSDISELPYLPSTIPSPTAAGSASAISWAPSG